MVRTALGLRDSLDCLALAGRNQPTKTDEHDLLRGHWSNSPEACQTPKACCGVNFCEHLGERDPAFELKVTLSPTNIAPVGGNLEKQFASEGSICVRCHVSWREGNTKRKPEILSSKFETIPKRLFVFCPDPSVPQFGCE